MQSLGPCGFSLDFHLPEQPIPEVDQALTLSGYWRQLDSPDSVADHYRAQFKVAWELLTHSPLKKGLQTRGSPAGQQRMQLAWRGWSGVTAALLASVPPATQGSVLRAQVGRERNICFHRDEGSHRRQGSCSLVWKSSSLLLEREPST